MNRLQEKYKNKIAPEIKKEFNLDNVMEVPTIKKICVNAGIGEFRENRDAVESFEQEFSDLVGQKVYPRKARLSEAGFKIKRGDVVGYSVTLRRGKMWAFLDKLITVVLPRVRDFRGLSLEAFDKDGNYSIGLTEHTIFPEVNPNKVKGIRSLQVTVVTDSKDRKMGRVLLERLGLPFRKE